MPMSVIKKSIAAAVLAAAGIAVLLVAGEHLQGAHGTAAAAKLPLPVMKVQKTNMRQNIELPAEFRPYQEVDVDAKVRGYVKSLRVDVGDRVKEGDVIAELEIPEASDDLAKAAAGLDRSRHQAAEAQAVFDDAQEMYQRLAAVMKERPELVAQEDLDQAKAKADAARAASVAAESAVSEAEAFHTQQRDLLNYSRITAPFDGVVTRLYVSDGALLGDSSGRGGSSSGRSVVHLSQLNRLRLVTKVPESLVPTIHDGASVDITIPALNIHKTLPVARISHQVDLETRTMHVEIDYPNTDLAVTPGLYADVDVVMASRSGVLAVPLLAVGSRKEDTGTVFVLDGKGRVQQHDVTLGLVGTDEVEVKTGLTAGELVVVGARPGRGKDDLYEPRFIAAR
jgi:RND family efflux transporter MFP subunit